MRWTVVGLLAVLVFGASTISSYYVNALWFDSLGYASVFWTRLNLQAVIFAAYALVTFLAVYGAFLALKPARFGELIGGNILINGKWVPLPVEPILKLMALGLAVVIALVMGSSMMSSWTTLGLFWHAPRDPAMPDPIFGNPLSFYLFTLPAWQLLSGWLLGLALIACAIAGLFALATERAQTVVERGFGAARIRLWRGLSVCVALLLLVLALREYLGRFDLLFQDQTIFSGAHLHGRTCQLDCQAGDLHRARGRRSHRTRCRTGHAPAALGAGIDSSGGRVLHRSRPDWLVRQQLRRQAKPTGARAPLHRAQHRDDAPRLCARSHRTARVSGRYGHRSIGCRQQPKHR